MESRIPARACGCAAEMQISECFSACSAHIDTQVKRATIERSGRHRPQLTVILSSADHVRIDTAGLFIINDMSYEDKAGRNKLSSQAHVSLTWMLNAKEGEVSVV